MHMLSRRSLYLHIVTFMTSINTETFILSKKLSSFLKTTQHPLFFAKSLDFQLIFRVDTICMQDMTVNWR